MAGKRYSKQRELIYECVKHTKEHPSAEMVYQWLKPENPGLSLGTVYRNLNLLADEGLLLRLSTAVDRYDADLSVHAHLHCIRCNQVSDLDGNCNSLTQSFAAANPQVTLLSCSLIYDGICSHCQSIKN
jgi:Fur family peroxide stress response transcriptional regulator